MSDQLVIQTCESLIEAYHRFLRTIYEGNYATYSQAARRVERLVQQVIHLAPTTMVGIRAKARAAIVLAAGPELGSPDDFCSAALSRSVKADKTELWAASGL
jgi:hypothetical protein